MKKMLLTVAALAALATTPAFAETYYRHHTAATPDAYSSYAAAPGDRAAPGYWDAPGYAASPNTVIVDGEVVGADPDPNIRYQLERDPPWNIQ
ncbi:MAG: hypothetical protein ACREB8_12455 [Pseudolabrys sp.]